MCLCRLAWRMRSQTAPASPRHPWEASASRKLWPAGSTAAPRYRCAQAATRQMHLAHSHWPGLTALRENQSPYPDTSPDHAPEEPFMPWDTCCQVLTPRHDQKHHVVCRRSMSMMAPGEPHTVQRSPTARSEALVSCKPDETPNTSYDVQRGGCH